MRVSAIRKQQNLNEERILLDEFSNVTNFNDVKSLFCETIRDYSLLKYDVIQAIK